MLGKSGTPSIWMSSTAAMQLYCNKDAYFLSWFGCKQGIASNCVLSARSTCYFLLSCGGCRYSRSPFLLIESYEPQCLPCSHEGHCFWFRLHFLWSWTQWQPETKRFASPCSHGGLYVSAGITQEENVSLDHRCRMLCEAGTERYWIMDVGNGKLKDVWKGGSKILCGHWCFSWNDSLWPCWVWLVRIPYMPDCQITITGEDGIPSSSQISTSECTTSSISQAHKQLLGQQPEQALRDSGMYQICKNHLWKKADFTLKQPCLKPKNIFRIIDLDPLPTVGKKTTHHKSKSKKTTRDVWKTKKTTSGFPSKNTPGHRVESAQTKLRMFGGCNLRSEGKKRSLCWGVYAGLTGWEMQMFNNNNKKNIM